MLNGLAFQNASDMSPSYDCEMHVIIHSKLYYTIASNWQADWIDFMV